MKEKGNSRREGEQEGVCGNPFCDTRNGEGKTQEPGLIDQRK